MERDTSQNSASNLRQPKFNDIVNETNNIVMKSDKIHTNSPALIQRENSIGLISNPNKENLSDDEVNLRQRDCALFATGRDIIPDCSPEYVGKNRTPHIDKRGGTCLILTQEVIYNDASNLYDKLTNNLATFSTPGMAILPSEELSNTPTDHNIFQLGKNKLAAQVTVFFTVVLIRTTACQTLP